jgi:hypothetical protein
MMERPFVVTPVGVRLCRPSEGAMDIRRYRSEVRSKRIATFLSTQKDADQMINSA